MYMSLMMCLLVYMERSWISCNSFTWILFLCNFWIRWESEYWMTFFLQGLKRLKKIQPDRRFGPLTSSSDRGCNLTQTKTHPKKPTHNASRERLAPGTAIPISIKYRKPANEEAVIKHSQHQHLIDEKFCPEPGTGPRHPLPCPVETGPKRIKVRGPSAPRV